MALWVASPASTARRPVKRCRVTCCLLDNSQTDRRGLKTKCKAELFLANVDVVKSRGEFVSAAQSRIRVGEGAEQRLVIQLQLKPSTHRRSESIVRSAIVPKWVSSPIAGLTQVRRPGSRCARIDARLSNVNKQPLARNKKCGPAGTRTRDPRIKSPMLYQLSYRPYMLSVP